MTQTTAQPPPKKLEYRTPPLRPKRSLVSASQTSFGTSAYRLLPRKIIDGLKSLAWVVPMTILIWVYAEREQVGKQTVIIHVEPRNSDSQSRDRIDARA